MVVQCGAAYRGGHLRRKGGNRKQIDDKFKERSLKNAQKMATSMKSRVVLVEEKKDMK